VEDESAVTQVIMETLSEQGYQVIEADNGASAYELTAEVAVAERPDLIVLDIMLPKMNGFEVLEKLKVNPQTAYIPVVIVSARNQTQDETRGIRVSASDFIAKPWSPGDLESRVKLDLDYRRSSKPFRISLSRQA